MKCPFCSHKEDKVIDSRSSGDARSIRRRRECLKCRKRFTTYENIEETSLTVIKKDGRRESFDRKKILSGIKKACEKRPIGIQQLEELVDKIEYTLQARFDKEVETTQVGELVMELLYGLDEVAYVRFASVYRQFKDINQFMKELKGLLNHNR
jgi:transcriptional repressor NrdR